MAMSPTPVLPPSDCSLVFHERLNFHMQNNPTLPMFIYADDQAQDHSITTITFLEFGRAAHRIAHTLRPERTGDEGQVVMLIANCDTILFHAVVAGMFMSGLVPFLVSPRNSAAAVVDMMKKTNCSQIMTLRRAHSDLIENIRQEIADRNLVVRQLPTFTHAFPRLGREVESDHFVPYPPSVSRPDWESPYIYIHSSGSMGFPKPIPYSHKFQACWDTQPVMQSWRKNLPVSSRIGVMGLPTFHGYGIGVQLYLPLICLVTAVVYAPRAVTDPHAAPVIPTTGNMLNYARWTGCKVIMTVPTFVEQWAVCEDNVEELKQLNSVLYAGGPLSEKIGDALCAAGVAITTFYGGTEFGTATYVRTKADILKDGDWNWMHFSEDGNIRWVPYGDGTHECQVLAREDHPVAVENLADVCGYATSDLWLKHPTKNLWKIVGRADDVIVLASGEKTVPAPMEGLISSSPFVYGALMFGRERNQVGLLVEPCPDHVVDIRDHNAVSEFRNKIWSLVEEANKTAPAFSRIFKEMILIAGSEKPMLRTPKGSIQKQATIKAYESEIDTLYNTVESTFRCDELVATPSWTASSLEAWLMELANTISGGRRIDAKTDIFAQGFDSLSATYLRNKLLNAFRTSLNASTRTSISCITQNVVFENPTIKSLARRVANLVNEGGVSPCLDLNQRHVGAINAMIDKYSDGLPAPVNRVNGAPQNCRNSARFVVLLTGSTGSLGSFLLVELLKNPAVDKVYALNRPSSMSIENRQKSAFTNKGLPVELLKSHKLVHVVTDASQEKCGLPSCLYEELRNAVTMIIHNAWRLDFNLSLASFEPNIRATRNLVDLALDSHYRTCIRFIFVSSVASAQSWCREKGVFPEAIQLDPTYAVGLGYGEAKYVCERIIAKSGLPATSLRVGQIAGGPNGSWATTDWVPIMVKSSIVLGAFPDSHGVVSWMRAEQVAMAVLEIAFTKGSAEVLNIVNPQRSSWTKIMSSVRSAVLAKKSRSLSCDDLPLVSFVDWVACLEETANSATPEDLGNTPAIKLLEFFRGISVREGVTRADTHWKVVETVIPEFSTSIAQRVSKTVAGMCPMEDADARAWVNHWSSVGLF